MKISGFILLYTLYCILHTSTVVAQSPTPTKQVALQPTPTVGEDIKEKVKERIESIKLQSQKRAFWGIFKKRVDTTLILETVQGEKRIKTDDKTVFVNATKKQIKITDLEIDNFIIALGYWQENGTLTAKRVIVLTKAPKPAPQRQIVFGRVSQIDKNKKILAITHPKKKTITEIKVESSTIITKKVDGSIKKVVFAAINIGDRLVAITTKKTTEEILTAKIIHVVPGLAEGQTTPTPTPRPTSGEIFPSRNPVE